MAPRTTGSAPVTGPTGLVRRVARALTGSTYAVLGLDALRSPGARVGMAGPTLAAVRRVAPLPGSDETVVRGNAAVQAAAGALLAVGVLPRACALVLVGSLVPTTVAGHGFWTIDDPAARTTARVQFQKNLAMIGGLLFTALDTPAGARTRPAPRRSP